MILNPGRTLRETSQGGLPSWPPLSSTAEVDSRRPPGWLPGVNKCISGNKTRLEKQSNLEREKNRKSVLTFSDLERCCRRGFWNGWFFQRGLWRSCAGCSLPCLSEYDLSLRASAMSRCASSICRHASFNSSYVSCTDWHAFFMRASVACSNTGESVGGLVL